MLKGLERLFWLVGGFLIVPFVVQQGLALSSHSPKRMEAPQLYSTPVAQPAVARKLVPVHKSPVIEPRLEKPDTSLWSASRIAAWGETVDIVDRPAATLFIPSLHVEIPVFDQLNEAAVTLGASLIPGTGELNKSSNLGLASHRDGHFRHLKDLTEGDLLLLRTDSTLRQFRVVNTRIVRPEDTWVLEPSETPSITLVTCYPFYFVGSAPQRYIVSAQEVQTELTSVQLENPVIGGHHATMEF